VSEGKSQHRTEAGGHHLKSPYHSNGDHPSRAQSKPNHAGEVATCGQTGPDGDRGLTVSCDHARGKGPPRSEGVVGDPSQKTPYQRPATGDRHLQVGRARPRGSNYVPATDHILSEGQSPLSSRSTSGTSVSRRRPLAPEPTPPQTVDSTETSRQSPCPSGNRSLQSPAAPRRSPRVPSRSASRGGGTPVSSLLTAAVVSLQGFASQDTPNPLGRAVVYELRARGGLSSTSPFLYWVPSSEKVTGSL
jgi:hypothetical protein